MGRMLLPQVIISTSKHRTSGLMAFILGRLRRLQLQSSSPVHPSGLSRPGRALCPLRPPPTARCLASVAGMKYSVQPAGAILCYMQASAVTGTPPLPYSRCFTSTGATAAASTGNPEEGRLPAAT